MSKDIRKKESAETPCQYDCPLGGDTANDCADCYYAGDYHFDEKTGCCVRRP